MAEVIGKNTAERDTRQRSLHIEMMEKKARPCPVFPQRYAPPLGLSMQTDGLGGEICYVLEQKPHRSKIFICYQYDRCSYVRYNFLQHSAAGLRLLQIERQAQQGTCRSEENYV